MKRDPYLDGIDNLRRAEALELTKEIELFAEDIGRISDSDCGKRFLWWLFEESKVFETCYTGNSDTYYAEGKRDLGLKVLHLLTSVRPEAMLAMIKTGTGAQKTEEDI